jgi:hypothetical protein
MPCTQAAESSIVAPERHVGVKTTRPTGVNAVGCPFSVMEPSKVQVIDRPPMVRVSA